MPLNTELAELETKIAELIPTANFDEDNYGQLVIYTGLIERDNKLVTYDPDEDGYHKEDS